MNAIHNTICASLVLAGLASGGTLYAADAEREFARGVNEANAKLRGGDVDGALQQYANVRNLQPKSADLSYNMAVAQYRKGDMAAAEPLFQAAATSENDSLAAKARYNLGNCNYAEGLKLSQQDRPTAIRELESAIDQYRSSLEVDTNNADARANIELASQLIDKLRQEEKQQQEQQQNQQNQQQDQQQKQEQQSNDQQQNNQQQNSQDQQQQNDKRDQKQQSQQNEQQQKDQQSKDQQSKDQESKDQKSDSEQQNDKQQQDQQQSKDQQKQDSKSQSSEDKQQEQQQNKSEQQQKQDQQNKDQSQQDQASKSDQHKQDEQKQDSAQQNQQESAQQDQSHNERKQDRPQQSRSQRPQPQQQNGEPEPEDTKEQKGQQPPQGELKSAAEEEVKDGKEKKPIAAFDPSKDGEMTQEEAEKMLQAIRDREMLRRYDQRRQEVQRHIPVDRDW